MKKFLYSFLSLCLMLFLILFSVFTVVNTQSFFTKQYIKNGTEADTGMSLEDLNRATEMLLDYLNDRRDNLDMQAEEFGKMAETFDEREKSHMVDVKALYRNFAIIMYTLLAVCAVGFGVLYAKDRRQFFSSLLKGAKFALAVAILLCAFFGAAFTIGFDSFWTTFHKVMFTNDLWLLDPRVSTMINMFPLNFWLAMCSKILIRFAVLFFAYFAAVNTVKQQADRKAKV